MAGNRKLPFGYKMAVGAVAVDLGEAGVVRQIFQKYVLGASYKELVAFLRKQEIPYDCGRIWNKNMVARILENKKYLGQSGWPVIITLEQFEQAARKRSGKASPLQKTEVQKVLRRLGCSNSSEVIEQRILRIFNQLIAAPEQICLPRRPPPGQTRVSELRQALKHELERQPVNEDDAKRLTMALASAQYEAIGNEEYETERLRRLFQKLEPMSELDADLLRLTTSVIQIRSQKLRICLKNGQIIEGGTAI